MVSPRRSKTVPTDGDLGTETQDLQDALAAALEAKDYQRCAELQDLLTAKKTAAAEAAAAQMRGIGGEGNPHKKFPITLKIPTYFFTALYMPQACILAALRLSSPAGPAQCSQPAGMLREEGSVSVISTPTDTAMVTSTTIAM
jgi:hypothetical protein